MVKAATTKIKTEIIFIRKPVFIICLTLICPLENTIAFGGVEIGIINAQLAAIATGIANNSGFNPRPLAIPITTGI